MKIEKVEIGLVIPNKDNPRTIKDEKFEKLVNSIKEFPTMLKIRPIVVNEQMVALGGNQRLKACKEAGLEHVYIIKAKDLTPEQEKEFIIKDNVGFGDWDWEKIGKEWEGSELSEWGMDVFVPSEIDLDDFFEETETETESTNKIVLEFSDEDFEKITEKLSSMEGTKESIIWNLLGL